MTKHPRNPEPTPIGEHAAIADINRSMFKAVSPTRRYPTRCFEKALEFALKNRKVVGLQLVHGTIQKGIRIDHAWVELPGDVIFDAVDQAFYKGASYRAVLASIAEVTYQPRDAAKAALAGDNYGPWHKSHEDTIGAHLLPVLRQLRDELAAE